MDSDAVRARSSDEAEPDDGERAERLVRMFVYRCRPCEYVSPTYEQREVAKEHADWHRHSFEHFFRFMHIEGIEPVVVEVADGVAVCLPAT